MAFFISSFEDRQGMQFRPGQVAGFDHQGLGILFKRQGTWEQRCLLFEAFGFPINSRFACFLMDFLVCCSGALCTFGFGVLHCLIVVWLRRARTCAPKCESKDIRYFAKSGIRFRPAKHFRWLFVFLVCSSFRIGEAKVPGPEAATWQIGICNPAGLPNKTHMISNSMVDLWLISETHLSRPGYLRFRSQLSEHESAYRWCVPGKHVVPRSTTSDHGSWSGVAALSKHPTRKLPVEWSPCAFDTSRLLAVTTYCHGLWLSGLVVYGVPAGPTHPQARLNTEAMLQEAVGHLAQMTGPRFLAGDFNHDLDALPPIEQLRALHFVEVQDLHFQRTGVAPQPTSRRKARRDFLFISAELVPFFRKVVINHDHWIDHATVVADFEGGSQELTRYPWPKPRQIPWKQVRQCTTPELPLPSFLDTPDCTIAYAQFWQSVEDHATLCAASNHFQLPPSCKGRGQRLKPKVVKGQDAPLKPSRAGEILPKFLGLSFLHKHRFRQLRRLQSYQRIARVKSPSSDHLEHRRQLWKAICQSPGFAPNFVEWWLTRPKIVHGDAVVGFLPADSHVAALIFEDLEVNVRDLEDRLKKTQPCSKGSLGPPIAKLYKAVRKDAPMQVDVLFQQKISNIIEVQPEDVSIIVDPPQPWDERNNVVIQGKSFQPIVATPDQIWLETLDGIQPGQAIVQTTGVGKLEIVFQQFLAYWSKFWCTHSDVPLSQWEDVLAFARHRLPNHSAPPLTFTPSLVRAAVRAKKNTAAVGLDGVSKLDLVHLTTNQMQGVVQIFQRAGTGQWPAQVLEGVVKSLAKKEIPMDVPDFRPIIVFPILYRIWSSIASKYWLHHLDSILATTLCGNRNGYQAATLWRQVMESIEASQTDQIDLCGLVIDLTKAYNTLPRLPALAIALHCGVDQQTLQAWSSALSGMKRRFWVNGSVSGGTYSNRGFPEGCGMSCLAMLLLTQLWHTWTEAGNRLAQPLSFVDNWEILCSDASQIAAALDTTLALAEKLDIQVDKKKTFAWATTASSRTELRQRGFVVTNDCRDLGSHIVFSKQIRNSTAIRRFDDLQPFWSRLKAVRGTFQQKARVVRTAGWPRALHAVSGSLIGRKHFHRLRTQAAFSLDMQKPGSNAFVLCLLENLDPHFQAIVQTLREWRNLGNVAHQRVMLAGEINGQSACGPCTLTKILVQRLHCIGWSLADETNLTDHRGFSLAIRTNWSNLLSRLEDGWKCVVAAQVCHRPTFREFQVVDVNNTRRILHNLEPYDQGILRNLLVGATQTNQHTCFWTDSGTTSCAACGAPDSLWHRFWECDTTQQFRDLLPDEVQEVVPRLPAVLTWHGWEITSPYQEAWNRALENIPRGVHVPPRPGDANTIDLFTDGSCLWPAVAEYRVAAWSITYAPPLSIDPHSCSSEIVCVGHLSGALQSAFRAELFALLAALECVEKWGCGARIWIDCQGVIDKFHLYVHGKKRISLSSSNADLWLEVWNLMQHIKSDISLIKVDSHETWNQETTTVLQWARIHNSCADRAARICNNERQSQFWELWRQHSKHVNSLAWIASNIRAHQLTVCRFWTETYVQNVVSQHHPVVPRKGRIFAMIWENVTPVFEPPALLIKQFGSNFANKLVRWWEGILDGECPTVWTSFAQLYLLFQQDLHHPGMVKHSGSWVDPELNRLVMPCQLSFRKRCKFFRLSVQQFWKHCKFSVGVAVTRPHSNHLCCHVGCASIPIKQERVQRLETWLGQQLAQPIRGQGADMDRLPLAW